MSGVFSKPKTPTLPKQEVVETKQSVQDDAGEEQRRSQRRIAQQGGRDSTMFAGIQKALKERLGQ